jgi:unsaturated chondroitin disaccharide hydrolase
MPSGHSATVTALATYAALAKGPGSFEFAVCGILEMNRHADCLKYLPIAEHIMDSLAEKYTSARLENSNVVLTDGMYARPFGHKPEGTIFGDYFYMEALMRELRPEWKIYW